MSPMVPSVKAVEMVSSASQRNLPRALAGQEKTGMMIDVGSSFQIGQITPLALRTPSVSATMMSI